MNEKHFFCLCSSAPARAPDIIVAHNSSSTSLIVTWSHLPKQYFNGEPLGYKVTYHQVGLERNIRFVTVTYTNITEPTNLSAFTIYVINVSAVSSGGVGPWNTVKARTDDAGTDDIRWTAAQLGLLSFFVQRPILDCLFILCYSLN